MDGSAGRRAEGPARLGFLDGIRGLAAAYVVLHHAALEVAPRNLPPLAKALWGLCRHGHYAVAVFIVLSGFCLMRPVLADPEARLRGGFFGYMTRRARRILPPYFAALLLCWLAIALVPALREPHGTRWDRALPAFETGTVVSHLFLVHNLSERWLFTIDPPMWSVATEWQIYFLFPVLLAAWRRFGTGSAAAAGFAGALGVLLLGHLIDNPALFKLSPWYLGLFTLGMAAAGRMRGGRRGQAWGWMLAALLAGLTVLSVAAKDRDVVAADLAVGLVAAALVGRLAGRSASGAGGSILRRGLESPALVGLGGFSYSLYLIHFPLLALAGALVRSVGLGPTASLAFMLAFAAPACLPAAWGFAAVFERPFQRSSRVPHDKVPRAFTRPFLPGILASRRARERVTS